MRALLWNFFLDLSECNYLNCEITLTFIPTDNLPELQNVLCFNTFSKHHTVWRVGWVYTHHVVSGKRTVSETWWRLMADRDWAFIKPLWQGVGVQALPPLTGWLVRSNCPACSCDHNTYRTSSLWSTSSSFSRVEVATSLTLATSRLVM